MGLSSMFASVKTLVRVNFLTRISGIMMKGTLGQKVAVVIGCLGILMGLYKAFFWLLLALGGYVICFLAFQDYDRIRSAGRAEEDRRPD